MTGGLGSAPLPPPQPDDHRSGPPERPLAIVYADYECPYCAVLEERLVACGAQRIFRHFPVTSKHPRAGAAACAAEAAGLQGRFWEMHALLFADQGRLEDPHLWARAERLGLDVERFDADRRSEAVIARVKRDFVSGVRVGVVTTPTLFLAGEPHPGLPSDELIDRLG
ncbi:DsbA family protein [Conexibacter sp. CPCC 206217]|uniref:DsbA family protein n=1 Tax=Conexibacter sp. CPCC 206217 TaxID=3064574 RepID=UPI0027212890|nr:DsbA family protein [Conexibacter sp. CPCC 206217]MDO8210691.1 DsbA family protein [Conexibacter sp. CPCC 206217]